MRNEGQNNEVSRRNEYEGFGYNCRFKWKKQKSRRF